MTGKPESEAADDLLNRIESIWRGYYSDSGPILRVHEGESPSNVLEVGLFAFGLMASIMRTTRAQILLVNEGYTVESRALFRSIVDQAMALTELERSGVHAVHAYGKVHAHNLSRLREASRGGFELGDVNEQYIEKFIALADSQPVSVDDNKAVHAIKTATIASKGKLEALLYQVWLEATPLSKPSMRLADAYAQAERTDAELQMHMFIDSDPDSIVDPRLVLAAILPEILRTYARILRDDELVDRFSV